jgi:hypothetical protein
VRVSSECERESKQHTEREDGCVMVTDTDVDEPVLWEVYHQLPRSSWSLGLHLCQTNQGDGCVMVIGPTVAELLFGEVFNQLSRSSMSLGRGRRADTCMNSMMSGPVEYVCAFSSIQSCRLID